MCESNLGSLAIAYKKYDKAIFHLLNSLEEKKGVRKRMNINLLIEEAHRKAMLKEGSKLVL